MAPRTTSNGSFGGVAAMVAYFLALIANLSIRALGFVALESAASEMSQLQRFVEEKRLAE